MTSDLEAENEYLREEIKSLVNAVYFYQEASGRILYEDVSDMLERLRERGLL